MIRILTILIHIQFLISPIFSQDTKPIQTGPRLVLGTALNKSPELIMDGLNGLDTLRIREQGSDLEYGLGMFMQFNLKEYLFIRPEAIVHISNRGMDFNDLTSNMASEIKHQVFSFSVPIQIGYQIDGWSLQTGIVWRNHLRTEPKNDEQNFRYEYQGTHSTFLLGLGYQSKWLLVDLYYENAFGNANRKAVLNGKEFSNSSKSKYLSLRLGFILSGR